MLPSVIGPRPSPPPADLRPGQLYPLAATRGASGRPVVFSVATHSGCAIFVTYEETAS